LACLGVGKLVLIDDDRVELSNLNRQVLFRPQDLGALKVDVVAAALRSFNPELEVDANAERIGGPRDLARFLPGAAIVIATADWPPYQVNRWINEACVRARVPHLSAGQVPPYIRVGPMVIPGATGCVECDERAARARFVFYDDVAAQREQAATLAPTLGPASAMAGSMIGMEVLHYITQISRPMTAGRAITLDMRSWQTATRDITRDKGCPVCGDL
jgi:bacteriocin biosynthesis cyclodehydratase domain-containing protein